MSQIFFSWEANVTKGAYEGSENEEDVENIHFGDKIEQKTRRVSKNTIKLINFQKLVVFSLIFSIILRLIFISFLTIHYISLHCSIYLRL